MKHWRCQIQWWKMISWVATIIFLLPITVIGKITLQNEKYRNEHKDNSYYFSIRFPDNWRLEPKPETDSDLRLIAKSLDEEQIVFIYAVHAKGNIDLEKLADQDRRIFKNLGKLVRTEKIRKYFVSLRAIEKIYQSDQVWTKLVSKSDATFGYIIMCRGIKEDFSDFDKIMKTFATDVPFLVAAKDRAPGALKDAFGSIISGLVLFAVPFGLAWLSFSTRKNPPLNLVIIVFGTLGIGYLIWIWTSWKIALIGAGFILLATILGRVGFFIWLEET